MIDAKMLYVAMTNGLGPLCDDFETPELKRIHDLWIDGSERMQQAQSDIEKLIPQEFAKCDY